MGPYEVIILENTFSEVMIRGEYFSKSPVNRKIGKVESLVIVAGENLTEIRPIGAQSQNGKFSKMGLIEVMILANTFQKAP